MSRVREGETRRLLTEVVLRITRAFPNRPIGAVRAMRKEVVLISNVLEEVNLVLALEESSGNTVNYGVSPTLKKSLSHTGIKTTRWDAHLVVEPSRGVEVVKELRVRFASPKVHVSDFKITPNCALFGIISSMWDTRK